MKKENWVSLPCEGSALRSCRFEGYGKRGYVILKTEGHPEAVISTHDFMIRDVSGVEQRFRSVDDLSVELLIEPQPGNVVILREAKIDFWLDDASLPGFFDDWGKWSCWEANAVFSLTLSFMLKGAT